MSLTNKIIILIHQKCQALGSQQMNLAAEVYCILSTCQALCALPILAHVMHLLEVSTIQAHYTYEDTDAQRGCVTCLSHKAELGQRLTHSSHAKPSPVEKD